MMSSRWSTATLGAEAEDLEFRYRSLLAAQRILSERDEVARNSATLRSKRLRRLRQYVQNSLESVEQRMRQLGMQVPKTSER